MKTKKNLFTILGCILLILSVSSCIIVEISDPYTDSKIQEARDSIKLTWTNKTEIPEDSYSIFEWTQPSCLNGRVERYLLSKNDASQFSGIKYFGKKDFWIVPLIYQSSRFEDEVSIKSSIRKVTMNYLIHYDEPVYLWIEYIDGNFYNLGQFKK